MATNFAFRRQAVRSLTNSIGVYVLCDLDGTGIYVGKSADGIRSRVARHLTSARSDVIANRQIDVWEIAYVRAYPVKYLRELVPLEAQLYQHFSKKSSLMNGVKLTKAMRRRVPKPSQIVQVMSDEEIAARRDPVQRLPRQAEHYAQLVSHFLAVKNSSQIAQAMDAHFTRLQRYHFMLLRNTSEQSEELGESDQ